MEFREADFRAGKQVKSTKKDLIRHESRKMSNFSETCSICAQMEFREDDISTQMESNRLILRLNFLRKKSCLFQAKEKIMAH